MNQSVRHASQSGSHDQTVYMAETPQMSMCLFLGHSIQSCPNPLQRRDH